MCSCIQVSMQPLIALLANDASYVSHFHFVVYTRAWWWTFLWCWGDNNTSLLCDIPLELFNLTEELSEAIGLHQILHPFLLCRYIFIILERQMSEAVGTSVFKALLQFRSIREKKKKMETSYQRLERIVILNRWIFHLMTMKNKDRHCKDMNSSQILNSKEPNRELLKNSVRIQNW